MRGNVQHLDIWLDPNHVAPSLAYLDACDWELFVDWLSQDVQRVTSLLAGTWRVKLFKRQINSQFGGNGQRTKRLQDVGIDLDEADIQQSDRMFIEEAQLVYFNNETNSRRAELLARVRRQTGGDKVAIISQHRGFWRIPLVDTYYIDSARLVGNDDLPAEFDFLVDFGIHRDLSHAIRSQIGISSNGQILLDAIIALRDYVRSRSGLTLDGYELMNQAFLQNGTRLRVNPLTDPALHSSQQNEQKGFRELYCAVMTGLRNPITHQGASSLFTMERLPDKRTLLKYLSFLSILFERADGPMLT